MASCATLRLDLVSRSRLPPNSIRCDERLIVALDFANPQEALELVDALDGEAVFFKVGLELFCHGSGMPMVRALAEWDKLVFADFKLHDVPATVERATKQLNGQGINFLTVHAETPVMEAAVAAADNIGILGVTVLTSTNRDDLACSGFTSPLEEVVLMRAENAKRCGCAGIIASGQEAEMLKRHFGDSLLIITPGIRNAGESLHDQKRSVSVEDAFKSGADYIVVGRPIRDARDPVEATRAIQRQIRQAFAD